MEEKTQLVNCSFTSESSLCLAYMPFVKNGGLFVRTGQTFALNDLLDLSVKLMAENEPYSLTGKVIWITPKGAQGNKPAGIGIQLTGENSRYLCNKIETYLAGMLKSAQNTDTI
jgi:type IV pilus assembly protein PilZ